MAMGHGNRRSGIARRQILQAGTVVAASILIGRAAAAAALPTKFDQADIAEIAKDWPDSARAAIREISGKYGPPQEATATLLIWHGNGPWKRTIIHKSVVEHDFPMKHEDVLEQVAEYKVPLNFFNALAAFDGSVVADRTRGELTAHCDKEATNFVALNLAHDILRGRKTAEQARDEFAAILRDIQAGRNPEYAQKLLLGSPQGDLADPDTPVVLPASGSSRP
jgi:hypothetical protein